MNVALIQKMLEVAWKPRDSLTDVTNIQLYINCGSKQTIIIHRFGHWNPNLNYTKYACAYKKQKYSLH